MSSYKALTRSLARTYLRDPVALIFSLVLPPVLLVGLALAVSEQTVAASASMLDVIGPGVVAFGAACNGMLSGARSVADWRESGLGTLLRCAPVRVPTLLSAALSVAIAVTLVQALILAAVGLGMGAGMTATAWIPLALVPAVLGTLLFCSIGVVVGVVVPSTAVATAVVLAIVAPMTAFSAVAAMTDSLPGVQALSTFLPTTYLLDGLRWPLTSVGDATHALFGWSILAAGGASLFGVATWCMRWE
ncbi:ABC transporter permease [Actinomyces marmotae]|uniref:Transport permease protein n=1 Tax=Actinomyces marmotae TaxID=2737173 RepID=A0A6M8B6R0_9ACTO|nr:ABC transporter permease [Actinomyces marmotae]QKD78923.1 ABC transporter permease [Actinomyces marmotae]